MTRFKRRLPRLFVYYLVFSFLCISAVPSKGLAYVAGADELTGSRAEDSARVQRLIESKVVTERLERLGLSPDEVASRLDRLTDDELHSFALRAESLKAGGSGLGVVIALLVIVALVLIILQLTEHRVIFERTR